MIDDSEIRRLRHELLDLASGRTGEVTVQSGEAGIGALAQASTTLVKMLLKCVASERDESVQDVAWTLHADLSLLAASAEIDAD